jgi:hypothetical protein
MHRFSHILSLLLGWDGVQGSVQNISQQAWINLSYPLLETSWIDVEYAMSFFEDIYIFYGI